MTRPAILLVVMMAGCGAEVPDIDARGVCRSELSRPEPYPNGHPCYIAPSGGCVEFWHGKNKWRECDQNIYFRIERIEVDGLVHYHYTSDSPTVPPELGGRRPTSPPQS